MIPEDSRDLPSRRRTSDLCRPLVVSRAACAGHRFGSWMTAAEKRALGVWRHRRHEMSRFFSGDVEDLVNASLYKNESARKDRSQPELGRGRLSAVSGSWQKLKPARTSAHRRGPEAKRRERSPRPIRLIGTGPMDRGRMMSDGVAGLQLGGNGLGGYRVEIDQALAEAEHATRGVRPYARVV